MMIDLVVLSHCAKCPLIKKGCIRLDSSKRPELEDKEVIKDESKKLPNIFHSIDFAYPLNVALHLVKLVTN